MPVTITQNPADIRLNDQHEIDQILGNPPNWLLHWGISLVFIAAIVFSLLAWWIKYPDVLTAEVQILTENPTIRVIPLASGQLAELLVANQEAVQKDQLLAAIDNPVTRLDIIRLETFLAQLEQTNGPKAFQNLSIPEAMTLGSMQSSYANLIAQIADYQHFLKQTNSTQKVKSLQHQINHLDALNNTLEKQQKTLGKEVNIAFKNYQRNDQLNREGIISDQDLEVIETSYLQYQRQLDNFESQMINNRVGIEQLETQQLDLKQSRTDANSNKQLAIQESYQNLKSQIANWKQTFLITAPITGKINLTKIWSQQQFVKNGEELFSIVPDKGSEPIIAKALLPLDNAGKVKVGQAVNIRLNGFPYQEYGIIKSSVQHIALVPQENFYTLELLMPNKLLTTYDKVIPFQQEMNGMADIITEDRRILERIFDRVWSLSLIHI